MTTSEPSTQEPETVRVWDLPTRVFHWLLVACVIGSYVTNELAMMQWHMGFGLTLLALIVFRVIWGVIGGTTARFGNFVRGPGAAIRYGLGLLSGTPAKYAGHNPLGGWMVILLLLCLTAQAVLGLFSNDDILFDGPLRDMVSKETSDWLTGLHAQNFNILLGLISLHVLAAIFYLVAKRENLIGAMFTGRKPAAETGDPPARGLKLGNPLLALAIVAVAGAAIWWFLGRG